ncbi:MAG TPA: hypothetical protein VFR18_05850 [Terriglobia bacterium]|nr:hypothetical protein [Terriglobia bacterium]
MTHARALVAAAVLLMVPGIAMGKTIKVPRCITTTINNCFNDSLFHRDYAASYNTIDSALAAAVGGDRIYIQSGTYTAPPGGWKIKVPLEIFGDGTGDPYIGLSFISATLLTPASNNDRVIVLDDSLIKANGKGHLNHIYIHDLTIGQTINPTAQPNSDGIYCLTSATVSPPGVAQVSLRLARLRIANMGNDGIHLEGVNAGAAALQGVSIEDCTSHFNKGRGLYILNAQMFRLDGGIYSNNGEEGIKVASCSAPQLSTFECGANQTNHPNGDAPLANLHLEGNLAFRVTGGHFEDWSAGALVRDAVGITGGLGGYIGSCTFGIATAANATTARGIHIWYPYANNTGIVIGPNSWSYVPTMIEVEDTPRTTSCVVEPQIMYDYNPLNFTPKIIVPETVDRGHVVVAPVSGGSRTMAGVALPLLSTARRDSMTAAGSGGTRREGLVIYNATSHRLTHWDGNRWLEGIGGIVGSAFDDTATAAIGVTTLLSSPTVGMYRVTVTGLTATTMNKSQIIRLNWTDEGSARSVDLPTLGSGAGSLVQETVPIHITGGSLTFDTRASSGTMSSGSFVLRIRVEALP